MAPPDPPIGEITKGEVRKRGYGGGFVSKISPEVIADIDSAIRGGGSLETAAGFAGVSPETFRTWLRDGRRCMDLPRPQPEAVTLKVDLVEVVEKALADFKLSLTGGIFQHGRDSWQAWAWLAERRFPDEFGRRQRIEHGNADGEAFRIAPAMFDPSKLSDEELEQVRAILAKASPESHPVIEQPLRLVEGG